MKKIYLIRANKNPFGGAEKYLSRLTTELTRKNIDHQVIHSIIPNFLPSWFRVWIFNFQLRIFKGDKFYFSLERISCADIYRAGDGVHREFLKISKKSKLNPLHGLYLFLEKKCFKNAKKIIVNSQMIKDEIKKNYSIDEKKITLIYNGFDIEKLDYISSFKKLSDEFNIKSNDSIMLFVGSGFERKGVENFLRIISLITFSNIKAFVVGKENKLDYYQKLSKDLLIENKVFFTGPRIDVNDFFNISDVFIFPTNYEPFGNVILEAMAYGNAVFTTKKNGASEILNSEFVMSTPQDISLVNKINDLLENRALLDKIKKENIQIAKNFSFEKNVAETLRVIDEIIN